LQDADVTDSQPHRYTQLRREVHDLPSQQGAVAAMA